MVGRQMTFRELAGEGKARTSDPATARRAGAVERETDRGRVLELVRSRGRHGMTSDEAAEILGKPHGSVSTRFSELADRELIRRSKMRRKTRQGGTSCVWVAWEVRA